MKQNNFQVRIVLTNKCNFKCSYCKEHFNTETLSENQITKIFENLKSLQSLIQKDFDFILIGGEILLYQNLLLQTLKEIQKLKYNEIEIFTNLSLKINQNLLDEIQKLTPKNIKIITSFHNDFTNKSKYFKDNFEILKNFIVNYNIMYKNFKDKFDFPFKDFRFKNNVYDFTEIHKNPKPYIVLNKNFKNLMINTHNRECKIKFFQILINANGEVLNCQNDLINNYKTGIFFDKDLDLKEFVNKHFKTLKCLFTFCWCEHDNLSFLI